MTRPRHAFGQQPGRLVATMLRALAAELSEPGRYSRGKAYARDGAVIDIDIQPGVLSGLVLGTRPDPYQARLVADPANADELSRADNPHAATMSLLIPGRDELAVWCTCPDADGMLCKHAIAVLLVFADEASIEPDLLPRWRTPPGDGTPLIRAGERRLTPRGRALSTGDVRVTSTPSQPAPPTVRVDVLAGLLAAAGPLPQLPRIPRHRHAEAAPLALTDPTVKLVADLTASAIDALTRPLR